MKVIKVPPRYTVELRMFPDHKKQIVEVRFWFKGELTDVQIFKEQDLPLVHFSVTPNILHNINLT